MKVLGCCFLLLASAVRWGAHRKQNHISPSPVLVSTVCVANAGSWPCIFSAQPMKLHQIIIQSGQMRCFLVLWLLKWAHFGHKSTISCFSAHNLMRWALGKFLVQVFKAVAGCIKSPQFIAWQRALLLVGVVVVIAHGPHHPLMISIAWCLGKLLSQTSGRLILDQLSWSHFFCHQSGVLSFGVHISSKPVISSAWHFDLFWQSIKHIKWNDQLVCEYSLAWVKNSLREIRKSLSKVSP